MTFIVGYSPWHEDVGVLDLAAQLARPQGQSLRVVIVVPAGWPTPVAGSTDRDFEQWAAQEGAAGVEQAKAVLAANSPDIAAEVVWLAGRSVPQTLLEQAQEHGGKVIVVGSASHGATGHITLSSKTDRLLHSSPVPVVVAPRGYRPAKNSRITRATCAFRGDGASRRTLTKTAEICRDTHSALRVVTFGVRGRRMYPPTVSGAEQMVLESWMTAGAQAQAEALAQLKADDGLPKTVESTTAVGRSWPDAMDDLEWHREDLLVVGSSSARTLSQIFLGSSAAKIVRHSPVPVIVVP